MATLAHDSASRHKLDKKPPFAIDKPFGRRSRGGTRSTSKEKSWHMAQRTADFADRRANFCAGADQHQPQRNHELLPLRGARGCTTKRKLITPHLPLAATETQAHTQDPSALRLPRLAVHPLTLRFYTRNARAPTSPRSIGFCVIWDCISSSSSFTQTKLHQTFRRPCLLINAPTATS